MVKASFFIKFFAVYLVVLIVVASSLVFFSEDTVFGANLKMLLGVAFLWIILLGLLMYKFRDKIKGFVQKIPLNWKLKFILFCTILALIEEFIAVTMTNLGPFFGSAEAYITATSNYFDLVAFHSVVIFIPMFIVLAFLLARYDFSPGTVLILFGLTGFLAETPGIGFMSIISISFLVFVYGLMVYLPAYCIPIDKNRKKPKFWHYVLTILLPLVFAFPVAFIMRIIHPTMIHF